ncbi:hypothetical protein LEP1GSC073_1463 [Leptospira noguchii str. Cascata]|nr:hypothetical protein LEP1GSC072_0988 [Leptospira noguchii str. Bonito]EMS85473.1 hypothetical protein LEP1GSC073_1463 [Leptospira noguchii str. Cascata]
MVVPTFFLKENYEFTESDLAVVPIFLNKNVYFINYRKTIGNFILTCPILEPLTSVKILRCGNSHEKTKLQKSRYPTANQKRRFL